jgi:hypothetical protein
VAEPLSETEGNMGNVTLLERSYCHIAAKHMREYEAGQLHAVFVVFESALELTP